MPPHPKKKDPEKLSHRIYYRPLWVVSRDVQIEFKNQSLHYTQKFIHLLPSNNKNIKKDKNVNYINKNIGLNCTTHTHPSLVKNNNNKCHSSSDSKHKKTKPNRKNKKRRN